MATIVQRRQGKSVSYQVKVRLKGFPGRTATFSRKTDAARWASATETHLREARHFPAEDVAQRTLSDLVSRYQREILPRKKYAADQRAQLDWWNARLGKLKLPAVTPAKVAESRDRLLTELTARGRLRSPSTAVRYLAVLSHTFSIAIREWDWADQNPVLKVSKPTESRGRVRFLDDGERERLSCPAACRRPE